MRSRLPYFLVGLGLTIGILVARVIETEPLILGWLFAIGGGLAGGAFLAALVSNEPLAGGPASRSSRQGAPGRPAWFDEDEETDRPDGPPRNGAH